MKELKRCSKCKIPKSIDEFHKRKTSKDGHDHYCKECSNASHRNKYNTDIEYKERMKRKNIKRSYMLSDNKLTELNKITHCQICNTQLIKRKCIDHNHITGNIRGILCTKCNNLLGQCNDSIEILSSAITYIKNNN
jgi:hypothetical protein